MLLLRETEDTSRINITTDVTGHCVQEMRRHSGHVQRRYATISQLFTPSSGHFQPDPVRPFN